MMVLAGDIGGTHTRLQLVEFNKVDEAEIIKKDSYLNKEYTDFDAIIKLFLQGEKHKIVSASFGVAGPVINGVVSFTNLPWVLDTQEIKAKLRIDHVALINDFIAIGYGLGTLMEKDLVVVQEGIKQSEALRAYIGAGTGLGMGFISYFKDTCSVYATEGGHVNFAPADLFQIELLQYLFTKYKRVSVERVLSGHGLSNIYRFICDRKELSSKNSQKLQLLAEQNKDFDFAATISEYAFRDKDPSAIEAMNIFTQIYGAVVGNFALTTLPFGGLYIVGGIAPKLLPMFSTEHFSKSYIDKGRVSGVLKNIPMYIVLREDVGLMGAAIYASKLVNNML